MTEGIRVRRRLRPAFVGEGEANLVVGEIGHQLSQPLANESRLVAFGAGRIDQAARAPVDLHGRRGERMRRLLPFGLRKGADDASLTETRRSASCSSRVAAQQVFDTELVDPDAPEVEEAEAEQQDDDRSSGQRVGDQPSQHRFTAGRKM